MQGDSQQAGPYSQPLPKAVKLVRVLCQASSILANRLVEEGLLELLMRFIAGTSMMPHSIAQALYNESLRAWTVCIRYGLRLQAFHAVFPHLLSHIKPSSSHAFGLELTATTLAFFRQLTEVSTPLTVHPCPHSRFRCRAYVPAPQNEGSDELLPWSIVARLPEAPLAQLPSYAAALTDSRNRLVPSLITVFAATVELLASHWERSAASSDRYHNLLTNQVYSGDSEQCP